MPESRRLIERNVTHVETSRRFPNDHCLAVDRDVYIRPRILALLARRRPSAVARFVVPIHVDAINGMPRGWARPHIIKEHGEAISPPIAHADAPSSVVRKAGVIRVEASSLSLRPSAVLCGYSGAVELATNRRAVCQVFREAKFSAETSATIRSAGHELNGRHNGKRAAIAATFPCRQSYRPIWSATKHDETSKPLARSINKSHAPIVVQNDTEGCILVGTQMAGEAIVESRKAFEELFADIRGALDSGEEVWITVLNLGQAAA